MHRRIAAALRAKEDGSDIAVTTAGQRLGPFGEVFSAAALMPPSRPAEEALAVWLHGLGDSGEAWSRTAPALQRLGLPMLQFIFPTAPLRDTSTPGRRGPPESTSWFHVDSLDPDSIAEQDGPPEGLLESVEHVLDLVEPHVRRGVPPSRIFLVGYSQGGAAALAAAMRAPRPLGGVLLLSSWLAEPLPPEDVERRRASGTPVHFFHGEVDPVVPLDAARQCCSTVESAAGAATTFHQYPGMAHSVCDEEVRDIAETIYAALE